MSFHLATSLMAFQYSSPCSAHLYSEQDHGVNVLHKKYFVCEKHCHKHYSIAKVYSYTASSNPPSNMCTRSQLQTNLRLYGAALSVSVEHAGIPIAGILATLHFTEAKAEI